MHIVQWANDFICGDQKQEISEKLLKTGLPLFQQALQFQLNVQSGWCWFFLLFTKTLFLKDAHHGNPLLCSGVSAHSPRPRRLSWVSLAGQRVRRRRGGTSIITASYGARRASSWPHMVAHIAFDMAIYMGRYMDNDQQPPWLSFAKVFNFCFVLLLKSIMVYGSAQHAILRRFNRDSHKWKESLQNVPSFPSNTGIWGAVVGILEHGRVSRWYIGHNSPNPNAMPCLSLPSSSSPLISS